MSDNSVALLIEEISQEISRDEKGWYFTQAAAARLCGMTRSTISEAFNQPIVSGFGLPVSGSKMLKSIARQGISPAGLREFKAQWAEGRVSDVLVTCLITYAATDKAGEKDPEVVALRGALTLGGLRGLLDNAYGIEDVGGKVMARLNGIPTRVSYSRIQAYKKKNIGAFTAAITGAITGHTPKAWNNSILPGQFGDKAGRIRDHADETTINLIEAAERGTANSDITPEQAAKFAAAIKRSAVEFLGYQGPELSPAKLTPRICRQVESGKRSQLADSVDGTMPLLHDGRKGLAASEED